MTRPASRHRLARMDRSRRVQITLFTELKAPALVELLRLDPVRDLWRSGRFRVAMAMLDLTPERAHAIHELEAQGVPVTAWLLLSEADGYWLNADNADKALGRFGEIAVYADRHGLRLSGIGLDIEPPRNDLDELVHEGLPALVRLIRRRRTRDTISAAESALTELCDAIRSTGRRVESYCLPPIVDEARVGSALLRRVLGILDPPADDRVPMAYSTYLGTPLALSFMRGSRAVALGVTGGGVFAEQDGPRVLDWEKVRRQLDWAASTGAEDLYVFSLEGCVEQGMLEPLTAWEPGSPPQTLRALALAGDLARLLFRTLLSGEGVLDRLQPAQPAKLPITS